jgi:DNA-binding NarL/FixJ family response regulator
MVDGRSKIFVVDDHPLVREWLGALIAEESDLVVCGEADEPQSALAGIEATGPDLVIVDLALRQGSGMDLIKAVNNRDPAIRVIVFSMHAETTHAERAVRAGAHGYITKSQSSGNMIAAIREVLAGKMYLSDQVKKLFVTKFLYKKAPRFGSSIELLSDREMEVFGLLGKGCKACEIAADLNVSPKTVHAYFGRIREKLNLPNSTQLLLEAVRWSEGERKSA